MPQSRPSRTLLILGALVVVAAALRFGTLDRQSFWLDESATVDLLRGGLGHVLSNLPSSESSPPLYYVLAWGWTRVFGLGEVGLRSLSALAGTLTVPVAYAVGRRVSPRAALWAAALAAVNPMLFYYAQEARTYGLLILLTGASLLACLRALESPTGRRLGVWAVVAAAALLTHYFAAFVLVPEGVWLFRRLGARRAAPALGAVMLVGLALVPLAARQRADGKSDWIAGDPLAKRVAQAPKEMLVGIDGPAEIVTALLAGLLALAAIVLLVRRGTRAERAAGGRMAAVAAAAIALPLVVSAAHLVDVFNGRNVSGAWIPVGVLVAAGLGAEAARRAGAALGVALVAISVFVVAGVLTDPRYERDDWRGVAHALGPATAMRVVAVGPNEGLPLGLYLPHTRRVTRGVVRTRVLAVAALRERRTGHAPSPPSLPPGSLLGFRRTGTRRTSTYAVATYRASAPQRVTPRGLARELGDDAVELVVQSP